MSEVSTKHKATAPTTLSFAVVTVSTSKHRQLSVGEEAVNDRSGNLIVQLISEEGHKIAHKEIIPDNAEKIKSTVLRLLKADNVDAVITTGGTGIAGKDITVETIQSIIEKELPGFGELFRKLSYEKIGSASILTRATAGVKDGKAVFCLPGSPDAVETAVRQLILPEAAHIVKHIRE